MSLFLDDIRSMSAEQEQIKDNQKWKIPKGCSFEKLINILTTLRNKNGDTEFVDDEKLDTAIDLSSSLITANLSFLNAIKLVEKESRKTKLTKIGNELAEAWVRDDENISKLIQQIIKESHLVDLYDYIQNNKGLTIAKLYSFIKSQARIPNASDGRPFSDVPFQGVKAILRLFEKAELLTNEQIDELNQYKNTNPDATKKTSTPRIRSPKKTTPSRQFSSPDSTGHMSLPNGIQIPLNSANNVQVAITQLQELLKGMKQEESTSDEETDSKDQN